MSTFSQILLAIILLLGGVVFFQYKLSARLSDERDRYKQNNTALLSDIERMQIDSTTMAVDAKALRLTIDEYERFRAADAEKIRQMGIKIKNLQAVAKHNLEVAAPINAVIRDTVFIRDTVQVVQQKVEMASSHIQLDAVIDNDTLRGDIRLPVTLQQTVWVEYKRKCLFWKKVKAIHQTISSDNPYVDIKYSEYIQIDKK